MNVFLLLSLTVLKQTCSLDCNNQTNHIQLSGNFLNSCIQDTAALKIQLLVWKTAYSLPCIPQVQSLHLCCLQCLFLTPEGKTGLCCTVIILEGLDLEHIFVQHMCAQTQCLHYSHTSLMVLCYILKLAFAAEELKAYWYKAVCSMYLFYTWTLNVSFPFHRLLLFKTD